MITSRVAYAFLLSHAAQMVYVPLQQRCSLCGAWAGSLCRMDGRPVALHDERFAAALAAWRAGLAAVGLTEERAARNANPIYCGESRS